MSECGMFDAPCMAAEAIGNWWVEKVREMGEAAGRFVGEALTWWVRADNSGYVTNPAVVEIQRALLVPALCIVTGLFIWQAIKMGIQRKIAPMAQAGVGVIEFVFWCTMGTSLLLTLYYAAHSWSVDFLDEGIADFGHALGPALGGLLTTPVGWFGVLVLSLFFAAVGLLQWLAMLLRMVGIVVVVALVPLAAAGRLGQATRPWMQTLISWALALTLYEPIAAVCYGFVFRFMAHPRSLTDLLVALVLMLTALFALPTLAKFFQVKGAEFLQGGAPAGGGPAGAALSAAAGAWGVSKFQSFMDNNGPASRGPSQPAGDSPGGGARLALEGTPLTPAGRDDGDGSGPAPDPSPSPTSPSSGGGRPGPPGTGGEGDGPGPQPPGGGGTQPVSGPVPSGPGGGAAGAGAAGGAAGGVHPAVAAAAAAQAVQQQGQQGQARVSDAVGQVHPDTPQK